MSTGFPSNRNEVKLATIMQKSSGRFLDAHEHGDHRAVTRPKQDNDTQKWIYYPSEDRVDIGHLVQKSSGGRTRFLDAYETGSGNPNPLIGRDYFVVTRKFQKDDDTQLWCFTSVGNDEYTIQQFKTGRFLDAFEGEWDNASVTRRRQDNDTQRWIVLFEEYS